MCQGNVSLYVYVCVRLDVSAAQKKLSHRTFMLTYGDVFFFFSKLNVK